MIELPLVFVAGFLGSSHCIGMCGPFALLLGASSTRTWSSGLFRQLLYSAGRVFTYSIMGAVAGYCGYHFANVSPAWVNVPALLSIVAGCFLLYQGLLTAGVLPRKKTTTDGPCLAGGLLANFLKSPARMDVFLAGLLTGFLPCGLVYGFVGMAASSRDIAMGALTMTAFGLGTIPIMVTTGLGGKLLSIGARTKLLRVAAWCIVVAGILSVARGVSFLGLSGSEPLTEACPLCP
ncbi:sulfite exporter TauE/SafE family protein [Planctomycetota bacterium]